jgi:ABC-type branched-subunit amino acid transport system ATPase component
LELLKIEKLAKSFGGLAAVKNCSFSIPDKQISCLIGPNGAGKTTIFNLITGVLAADEGCIRYNGRDICGLSCSKTVKLGISRTFQDLKLFGEFTVLQNVMVSIKERYGESIWEGLFFSYKSKKYLSDLNKAREVLNLVGLYAKANSSVNDLPYGEQKLVSLARILAVEADLMLLDEPASGLDKEGFSKLLDILERVLKMGKSIIVVEHNMDFVKDIAHKAIFLHQGEVLAEGTIADIVADDRLTEIYFGH